MQFTWHSSNVTEKECNFFGLHGTSKVLLIRRSISSNFNYCVLGNLCQSLKPFT